MGPETAPTPEVGKAEVKKVRRENLASLYQGFLTGIVRLQAGRQTLGDPEAFRQRMRAALRDAQREATAIGYTADDIRDAEFAIAAFLDEVILTSTDPGRQQWAQNPLGVDLFDEAAAGDVFFERLDSLKTRRNSTSLADLLEVYLLCLLLGFEGRHAGRKGEIHSHIDWLRRRIETIRRPETRITPEAIPSVKAGLPRISDSPPASQQWRLMILIAAGAAFVLFLLLKLNLSWFAGQIESMRG
jgi:type VI secretion system protein ImpK